MPKNHENKFSKLTQIIPKMNETTINKLETSGIVTLDLLSYKPDKDEVISFDIVPYLQDEYLLQEKPFRAVMTAIDWTQFKDKSAVIYCSNDALVPHWAYILICSLLTPYAAIVIYGSTENHHHLIWMHKIRAIDYSLYQDKKVVLRTGMGILPEMYVTATSNLINYVQTLMYGEAGSSVMIYKRKK